MALIEHRKARFDYEILEEYEAGIELRGFEVKSLKKGQGKLEGAHVIIRGGEAFLVNMHIPAYQPANTPKEYDPERTRKLLLSKKEIAELAGFEGQKGHTIVPLRVYQKGRKIKLAIAAVRGKKKHDKRHTIKERQDKRDAEREAKERLR